MEISKNKGERLENYFFRLTQSDFNFKTEYQGITIKDIELVLKKLNQTSIDKRDSIWCLLNNELPSLFANSTGFKISDGASTAQIGCYVGMLMRKSTKLDREGRDYWVRPLIDIAAIERVTFKDGKFIPGHIKAKSPNSAYRLSKSFVELLQSVRTDHFATSLDAYINSVDTRLATFAALEDAEKKRQGSSGHKALIEDSINIYAKTFLPGYVAMFTDYSDGDRVSEEEKKLLAQNGIVFGNIDDLWPDAILYNKSSNTLWFIEAVTSDGEADLHKIEGLKAICKNSNMHYGGTTTTYETWKRFAARQQSENNLAPGSFVWIRQCPNKQFKVC